jgi:Ser/Thr protein kinase RdoA (MazF antagonist)
MKTDILRQLLKAEYGLQASEISPIERGYTNQSFRVVARGDSFVLRCGWLGKESRQAQREELVLDWLAQHPMKRLRVPKVLPTTQGEPHVRVDGRTFHLFTQLPGEVLYSWQDHCDEPHLHALMRALSGLQHTLRSLPVGAAMPPLACFEEQLVELQALPSTETILATAPIRSLLDQELPEFLLRARSIIARARTHASTKEPLQWCHGDFQLENTLFEGDALVALVDFDTVRALPLSMDTAFALFNLTRDGSWEEGFRWDPERWRRGAESHTGPLACDLVDLEWNELFCLDQALLHLRAGQRSIWQLDQGIGFVGAFRGVLAS